MGEGPASPPAKSNSPESKKQNAQASPAGLTASFHLLVKAGSDKKSPEKTEGGSAEKVEEDKLGDSPNEPEDTKQEPVADKGYSNVFLELDSEIIEKMKQQNAKLKKEFAELKQKLEECIEKAKRGAKAQAGEKPALSEEELSMFYTLIVSPGAGNQRNRAEGCVL